MKTPIETFISCDRLWIRHTQGDPCPCDDVSIVRILEEVERLGTCGYTDTRHPLSLWNWEHRSGVKNNIIGWFPSDETLPDWFVWLPAAYQELVVRNRVEANNCPSYPEKDCPAMNFMYWGDSKEGWRFWGDIYMAFIEKDLTKLPPLPAEPAKPSAPKDPFTELKAAYAAGRQIQFFSKIENIWQDVETPCWIKDCSYRIKPDEAPAPAVKIVTRPRASIEPTAPTKTQENTMNAAQNAAPSIAIPDVGETYILNCYDGTVAVIASNGEAVAVEKDDGEMLHLDLSQWRNTKPIRHYTKKDIKRQERGFRGVLTPASYYTRPTLYKRLRNAAAIYTLGVITAPLAISYTMKASAFVMHFVAQILER